VNQSVLNAGLWRSAPKNANQMGLSIGTEHPEMRINWCSTLILVLSAEKMREEWHSALILSLSDDIFTKPHFVFCFCFLFDKLSMHLVVALSLRVMLT